MDYLINEVQQYNMSHSSKPVDEGFIVCGLEFQIVKQVIANCPARFDFRIIWLKRKTVNRQFIQRSVPRVGDIRQSVRHQAYCATPTFC